ncbi:MAG: NACHT domain-containing protein, partial [Gammaproteobacteria bacterium]
MAQDYHLEELGPRAFEQLTAALASAIFGPGVEVYGSGRDGGREATFKGCIDWSNSGGPTWDGYTVIQAKQREHVVPHTADNLEWLKGQVRNELNAWMDQNNKRSRFPDYLLFVTNVRLSADDSTGGVDQIRQFIAKQLDRDHGTDGRPDTLRRRGLRDVKVWHRDSLNSFISNNQSIRAAFPAILTVGDILTRLQTLPASINADDFAPVLRVHAQSTLRHDRWVRFGQAGGYSRQSIEHVMVDLPAQVEDQQRVPVLGTCLDRGNGVLRRSVWPPHEPRHLVVTGAPGNGKSTLATYLTQVYRSHFARHESNEGTVAQIIDDTASSLMRLDLTAPMNPRWPLHVALPEMAAYMGPSGGVSLKRWLSQQITERASIEVQPIALERWLKAWPCVLFLDGLDEVTAPALRARVLDEITELVESADQVDADLFIIITTRPTGYTERLLPEHFAQVDLDYLTTKEAVEYGRHITAQRLHDDASQCKRLLSRFEQAASDASTERLLKTPLQILILTFILENVGDLPANRYHLFWGYYDTIFRRETEKPTTNQKFLREHRDDITELHERVGLTLQVRCESTGETRARLPRETLRTLAHDRMVEVGHEDPREAGRLADRILEIATQRLVLLAADEDETVSFDVRSLQELMAARALINGDDETIRRNLNITARSPHWRNTWLFAAGKLFTEGDHRRNMVLDVVERYDKGGDWPGWLYPVGPELAAHLLDDGLTETKPAAQKRLVEIALRALNGPMPEEPKAVARGLSYAMSEKTLAALIRNALKNAFAGTPMAIAIAGALRHEGSFGTMIPGEPSDLRRYVDIWQYRAAKGPKVKVGRLLSAPLSELRDGDEPPGALLLESALAECDALALRETSEKDLWPVTTTTGFICPHLQLVLSDADASGLLDICLGALHPSHWAARSLLARAVWSARSREPIGHLLRIPYLRESGA